MESISYNILDVSPFCCILLNSDLTILYANKKAKETFGEGLIGLSIDRFSPEHQSDGQVSESLIRTNIAMAAVLGRKRFAWEVCNIDGESLPYIYEVDCSPLEIDGEVCLAMFYNLLDENCVGCPKAREDSDMDSKLEAITEYMPMVYTTFDSEFNILNCNQAAAIFFGMKDKQETMERYTDTLPEFQPDGELSIKKAKKLISSVLEEGVIVFEWMSKNPDGELLPSEVTMVRAESRGEYFVAAFYHDLRDFYKYKEMEHTLRHRLEAMLDSSPLACSIFDHNNNIIATSQKTETLFEIPDKQIFIDNFPDFSPKYQPDGELSKEKGHKALAEAHKNGSVNFLWLHQTRDGKPIPTEVHLKRVVLEGKNHIISYTRDLR